MLRMRDSKARILPVVSLFAFTALTVAASAVGLTGCDDKGGAKPAASASASGAKPATTAPAASGAKPATSASGGGW